MMMRLRWNRAHKKRMLTLLMLAALCLSLLPPATASATSTPLTESFENYGSSASGYTLPVSSTSTATQPWKTVVGGASSWAMGEESASP